MYFALKNKIIYLGTYHAVKLYLLIIYFFSMDDKYE